MAALATANQLRYHRISVILRVPIMLHFMAGGRFLAKVFFAVWRSAAKRGPLPFSASLPEDPSPLARSRVIHLHIIGQKARGPFGHLMARTEQFSVDAPSDLCSAPFFVFFLLLLLLRFAVFLPLFMRNCYSIKVTSKHGHQTALLGCVLD